MGAQAGLGAGAGAVGGGTDGRSGEESRPYLRQLIRDTHIAGQLFKAHSCVTQPEVPPGSLCLSIHPGLEGQESEREVGGRGSQGSRSKVVQSLGAFIFALFQVSSSSCLHEL